MSPESQRIAIAKVCGWKQTQVPDGLSFSEPKVPKFRIMWVKDENLITQTIKLPDYLNDLNAMHEAEKCLFQSKPGYYNRSYFFALVNIIYNFDPSETGWDGDARVCCKVTHSSASQRAEGFLRTLNLWED